jgi:AcrR family transcriptional regulator
MARSDTLEHPSDVAADEGPADGRRRRRHQNREAVIDALVASFADGVYQPSTAAIAARAGISPRSLFRYFDDVDDLSRAAIERQLASARPLFAVDASPDDPTATKIRKVVAARLALFEAIAPGARAGRVCAPVNPVVAAQLHESRSLYRDQVRDLFARELRARPTALPAVDVLLSFESRELLCVEQGFTTAEAAAALVDSLAALLDDGEPG